MSVLGFLCHGRLLVRWVLSGFLAFASFSAAATSWTLLDSTSGMILAAKNDDEVVNPGDFAKLMTIYTALRLTDGENDRLLKKIPISSAAASIRGQQRIYLSAGQSVELGILLRAVAVTGADDACLALADALAASRSDFVADMSRFAHELQLTQSLFVSPTAAAANRSCARDLARLTLALRHDYPEVFRWFSEKTFTYLGNTQRSRNILLWRSSETDGVMSSKNQTSFIASSVYHKSDSENDRHLVVVYLDDKKNRSSDAAANAVLSLFVKGRTDFETIRLFKANDPIAKLEVLGGNRDRIEVQATDDVWVSISKKDLESRGTGGLSTTIEHLQPFWAPLKKNTVVATLHVDFEGRRLASFPLVARYDIGEGSSLSRFIDSVRLKISAEPVHP